MSESEKALWFASSVSSYSTVVWTAEQWQTHTLESIDAVIGRLGQIRDVVAGASAEDVFGFYENDPREGVIEPTSAMSEVENNIRSIRIWLEKHPT